MVSRRRQVPMCAGVVVARYGPVSQRDLDARHSGQIPAARRFASGRREDCLAPFVVSAREKHRGEPRCAGGALLGRGLRERRPGVFNPMGSPRGP